jgi:hypothetical protein
MAQPQHLLDDALVLHVLSQLAQLRGDGADPHGEVVDRLAVLERRVLELLEEVLRLGLLHASVAHPQ